MGESGREAMMCVRLARDHFRAGREGECRQMLSSAKMVGSRVVDKKILGNCKLWREDLTPLSLFVNSSGCKLAICRYIQCFFQTYKDLLAILNRVDCMLLLNPNHVQVHSTQSVAGFTAHLGNMTRHFGASSKLFHW